MGCGNSKSKAVEPQAANQTLVQEEAPGSQVADKAAEQSVGGAAENPGATTAEQEAEKTEKKEETAKDKGEAEKTEKKEETAKDKGDEAKEKGAGAEADGKDAQTGEVKIEDTANSCQ